MAHKTQPSSEFEDAASAHGALKIAGIDEAGRGPLAGPVVAAAVVLPRDIKIPGINDSKLLSPSVRERLFKILEEKAVAVGIGVVGSETIDRINILQATRLAMVRAVSGITPRPDYLLIDGPIRLDLNVPQQPIIGGDRLSISVAAAAIMAKVTRDRIMAELHEQFPVYGFDQHKGYGTLSHREAIERHGPCSVHRIHFRGVREHMSPAQIAQAALTRQEDDAKPGSPDPE